MKCSLCNALEHRKLLYENEKKMSSPVHYWLYLMSGSLFLNKIIGLVAYNASLNLYI